MANTGSPKVCVCVSVYETSFCPGLCVFNVCWSSYVCSAILNHYKSGCDWFSTLWGIGSLSVGFHVHVRKFLSIQPLNDSCYISKGIRKRTTIIVKKQTKETYVPYEINYQG
uniref:Uncharacterized protein n=1 Tax=Anguilla anguilla TaxID=7936 RepID=A0A0E9WA00_ANGAN